VDLLVLDLNRREKIYRNMWYITFKFRKYLNCETLEILFNYMRGTSYFLMYRKHLSLRIYFH
jgi:hypothetical protein